MKLTLSEQISRIKGLIEQTEPVQGKCGITKACSKEEKEMERQNRSADIQSRIQQKVDIKDMEKDRKMSLDLGFNYLNDKREKDDRNYVQKLFSSFDKSLLQGGQYSPEQKFAVLYKVMENMRRRPQLSYATRLKEKFPSIDPKTVTLEQLATFANQLSWDKFVDWFLAGGPTIS